mmetsp:Transcript_13947/g.27548  ORF Transcript_13947/g.27548 Transcript_13947/m.27548 type:complete len:117 (+) Transcript_13947:122-472(+)
MAPAKTSTHPVPILAAASQSAVDTSLNEHAGQWGVRIGGGGDCHCVAANKYYALEVFDGSRHGGGGCSQQRQHTIRAVSPWSIWRGEGGAGGFFVREVSNGCQPPLPLSKLHGGEP